MIQKIIKVGNSAAITIPKEFLKEAKMKVGDEIELRTNGKIKVIYITPKKTDYKPVISPEFKSWLDEFIKRNSILLKKLANT